MHIGLVNLLRPLARGLGNMTPANQTLRGGLLQATLESAGNDAGAGNGAAGAGAGDDDDAEDCDDGGGRAGGAEHDNSHGNDDDNDEGDESRR